MNKETHYFRIGLFAILALAVLIAFLIVLGIGNLFSHNLIAETYFNESVKGLNVGSAVKYRGVKIGEVQAIDIVSDIYGKAKLSANNQSNNKQATTNNHNPERYIYVRFALYPRLGGDKHSRTENLAALHHYIKQGLRASLATQDLVGNVYLELNFTKPKKNPVLPIHWQPQHLYIPSARSTLSRFTDSIDRIFTELNQIDFKQILDHFDQLTVTANTSLKNSHIGTVSTQLTETLAQITQLTETVNQLLTSPQTKQLLSGINQSSELLQQTLKDTSAAMNQLHALAARANQLSASQQSSLVDTINALKQASLNLASLSANLHNNPSDIIFGQPVKTLDTKK